MSIYALEHLGLPCRLVGTPEAVGRSERLILPGVGAARATLASLEEQELTEALSARVRGDGVPFLGICIGLQVLFDHSEEGDTAVPRMGAGHRAAVPPGPPGAADRMERGPVRARRTRSRRSCPRAGTSTS